MTTEDHLDALRRRISSRKTAALIHWQTHRFTIRENPHHPLATSYRRQLRRLHRLQTRFHQLLRKP